MTIYIDKYFYRKGRNIMYILYLPGCKDIKTLKYGYTKGEQDAGTQAPGPPTTVFPNTLAAMLDQRQSSRDWNQHANMGCSHSRSKIQ